MEYVLDENGNIKIGSNGKPLVKGADGKEFEIDAIGAQEKINTLVTESNDRRKKLGEANTSLEAFGDLDPVVARKAIEDVAGMSDKNKVDMDVQRDAINKTWEGKQSEWDVEKKGLTDGLFQANVGSKFATSKVVKTLVLPSDIAFNTFGKQFNADGTANDTAGNVLYSKANPGKPAEFEEAMGMIIDAYPNKDSILKATDAGGGGGHTTNNGDANESKSARDNISEGLKAQGV